MRERAAQAEHYELYNYFRQHTLVTFSAIYIQYNNNSQQVQNQKYNHIEVVNTIFTLEAEDNLGRGKRVSIIIVKCPGISKK